MTEHSSRLRLLLIRTLPWLVLPFLMVFTYAKFFQAPYAGFRYDLSDGRIVQVFVTATTDNAVRLGDKLVQIDSVRWTDFHADVRQTLFDGVEPGQVVPLVIERDGQLRSIAWVFPGPTLAEILERLNSQWWLVYVFWLGGTATLLLVHPRDIRWRLLVAFNLLTALWLAAGSGPSLAHIWESAIVLRAAVWLCIPVYLHLHWVFPKSLARLPAFVLGLGYLAASAMAVAEWFQIPAINTYFTGFLLAVFGSAALLTVHFIFRPTQRRDIGLLLAAVMLAIIPAIGIGITGLFHGNTPWLAGGSLLALPAIPGGYFFVTYRRQLVSLEQRATYLSWLYLSLIVLGTGVIIILTLIQPIILSPDISDTSSIGVWLTVMAAIIAIVAFTPFLVPAALYEAAYVASNKTGGLEIRANRLLPLYLFVILLVATSVTLVILTNAWLDFPGSPVLIGAGVASLIALVAVTGYAPFQHFIERRVLGMPLEPTHLLETYAAHITTSLDTPGLVRILKEKILPSLFVRQSGLLTFDETAQITVMYAAGVGPDDLPTKHEIPHLRTAAGKYRPPPSEDDAPQPCPWVRLILPLNIGGQLRGLWLLGRRNPDDFYASTEIPTLQALADQTAIALTNVAQMERLHKLYQANIGRQETERTNLARELHDDVLNELAALRMSMDEGSSSPRFNAGFDAVTTRIRQIVSGLRPPMLNYGLRAALEELADDLAERAGNRPAVRFELPLSEARYAPLIEQHLYRIVQQAGENALRHAQAQTLRIYGCLEPNEIDLTVEDDGVGFEAEEQMDLAGFATDRHFGLVGMLERAELIDAQVQIDSAPGCGTRVRITWSSNQQ